QSTVTSRIAELERELGRPLFVREARGVALTEAGRAFLRYAQRSLAALEEGRAAVAGAVEGDEGQLRVMACLLPAAVDLPQVLKVFGQRKQVPVQPQSGARGRGLPMGDVDEQGGHHPAKT